MGLLTPFTDIFQADVAGSKAYKGLYCVLVAFGTLIFLNGVINSGTTFGDLITTTEILLPQSQVNFPVVFGCIEDEIFEEGGEDIAFEGENNCRENCKASVTGGAGAATEVQIGFYGELKGFPPGTPEKNAADMLQKLAKSLGAKFSSGEPRCFAANYHQEFKPEYDQKLKMEFGLTMKTFIAGRKTYGVIGFYEDGSTDADAATFTYTGFQNAIHTLGVSIDEDVDARGHSWFPKTEGPTAERYRVNTAVTPAMWTSHTAGAAKDTDDGYATLEARNDSPGTRSTSYLFYMDTFLRRRTTIRHKSVTSIFNELGAAFGASMLLVSWLFKDVDHIDGSMEMEVTTSKVFRFKSADAARTERKDKKDAYAVTAA